MIRNTTSNDLICRFFFSEPSNPIPTKEQALKKFQALGNDFWKQFIDACYIPFGPYVFDYALHGTVAEPGFYDSLEKGYQFACKHLTEKLTVDFYKKLQKILCAHFKGKLTNTEMDASEAGKFRNEKQICKPTPRYFRTKEIFTAFEKTCQDYRFMRKAIDAFKDRSYSLLTISEERIKDVEAFEVKFKKCKEIQENKFNAIQNEISTIFQKI